MPEGSTIRDCLADELQRRTCFSLLSHSENFLYSYIIDYHVVERALNVEEVGGRRDLRSLMSIANKAKVRYLKSSGVALTALL